MTPADTLNLAKAFRTDAAALDEKADKMHAFKGGFPGFGRFEEGMAAGYRRAADALEAIAKAEAATTPTPQFPAPPQPSAPVRPATPGARDMKERTG